jgi:hypothetical protein
MGKAPDQEEGEGKHGNATINPLCVPEVIVEVGVSPEAKVN